MRVRVWVRVRVRVRVGLGGGALGLPHFAYMLTSIFSMLSVLATLMLARFRLGFPVCLVDSVCFVHLCLLHLPAWP